jgi:hypothetical protein
MSVSPSYGALLSPPAGSYRSGGSDISVALSATIVKAPLEAAARSMVGGMTEAVGWYRYLKLGVSYAATRVSSAIISSSLSRSGTSGVSLTIRT